MASAFTHAFAGLALGRLSTARCMPRRFWVLAALCAILPDIDAVGYALGVPYESLWGHRGILHSFLFAAIVGVAVTVAAFPRAAPGAADELPPRWRLALCFFLVTASHALLDAMTTGGMGVAFFAPFSNARFFFPWRPIKVSPIGVTSFFSSRGAAVLASEFLWVWLPLGLCTVAVSLLRRASGRRSRYAEEEGGTR